MVENLKKNDQVVTSGGLYGRIEDIQGDQLRLEIAPGVIVKHERQQIAAVRSNKDK
jgi:preprotein translocase subunit YajC